MAMLLLPLQAGAQPVSQSPTPVAKPRPVMLSSVRLLRTLAEFEEPRQIEQLYSISLHKG
jgi:hypothetical protein